MNLHLSSPFCGFTISTERAESSYGRPVMILDDDPAMALGPEDLVIKLDDPLGWILPDIRTAKDLALWVLHTLLPPPSVEEKEALKRFIG